MKVNERTRSRTRTHLMFFFVAACSAGRLAWAAAPPTEGAAHKAMDAAIPPYVAVCGALASDRGADSVAPMRALHGALKAVGNAKDESEAGRKVRAFAKAALEVFAQGQADLHSGELERVRRHLFALTKPLVRYVGWFRAGGRTWATYYCPMAKASWLQSARDAEFANPYHGQKMLRCGERVLTRGEPPSADAR